MQCQSNHNRAVQFLWYNGRWANGPCCWRASNLQGDTGVYGSTSSRGQHGLKEEE